MLAPLQLRDFTIDEFAVEANPAYRESGEKRRQLNEDPGEDELQFQVRLFTKVGSEEELGLRLTAILNPKKGWDRNRYRARVSVFGEFRFIDDKEDRPHVDDLVIYFFVSGLNVLYGLIRGKLAETTSNEKYPRLILPVVNFQSYVQGIEVEDEQLEAFRCLASSPDTDAVGEQEEKE